MATAGKKVSVGCKLPSGLVLQLFNMVEQHEQAMGGGTRLIRKAERLPGEVHIKGYAAPFGMSSSVPVIGGFAITENVDGDFWDAWYEQNKDQEYIKNGLIFAHEKHEAVMKRATDEKLLKNGLEQLNPAMEIRNGERRHVDPRFTPGIETGSKSPN